MGQFKLIVSRDGRELMGGKAFRFIAAAFVALALAMAAGAAGLVRASPGPMAPTLVGAMLFAATFMPFLTFIWAFAGPILTMEKASGHLETLLATPLRPQTLWLAKSAAIVLPAFAIAAASAALIGLASALAAMALPPGSFTLPPQLFLVCLVGNPLLFFGLGALTVILALRFNPDAAIIPSFVLGFGLMALVTAGTALGIVDLSSWAFAGAYLGAGLLEWTLVLALERGLTKEGIVLSSRED